MRFFFSYVHSGSRINVLVCMGHLPIGYGENVNGTGVRILSIRLSSSGCRWYCSAVLQSLFNFPPVPYLCLAGILPVRNWWYQPLRLLQLLNRGSLEHWQKRVFPNASRWTLSNWYMVASDAVQASTSRQYGKRFYITPLSACGQNLLSCRCPAWLWWFPVLSFLAGCPFSPFQRKRQTSLQCFITECLAELAGFERCSHLLSVIIQSSVHNTVVFPFLSTFPDFINGYVIQVQKKEPYSASEWQSCNIPARFGRYVYSVPRPLDNPLLWMMPLSPCSPNVDEALYFTSIADVLCPDSFCYGLFFPGFINTYRYDACAWVMCLHAAIYDIGLVPCTEVFHNSWASRSSALPKECYVRFGVVHSVHSVQSVHSQVSAAILGCHNTFAVQIIHLYLYYRPFHSMEWTASM